MSTPAPTPAAPPRFLGMFTAHGRNETGCTGHVWDEQRKRSLCGVETARPWLNHELADLGGIHGPALMRWLTEAGTAYTCGTCLRLYRRHCERVNP